MGPLAGIKVLEIKGLGPGPYAGMLLADLGAEVVVVERSSSTPGIALPSAMDVHSRGKKSIALDLKTAEGLETLMTLVEKADMLFEGFRPGVAERVGFGPDACLARNPRLVYGRMTGWGQDGPLSTVAGHDINYIAISGALAAIGSREKPAVPLNLVGDYAGGSLFLVMGMLAALVESKTSGQGQVVDAAITDGAASLMSMFHGMQRLGVWSSQRSANLLDGAAHYYDVYETADGKFVSVGPLEPQFYALLLEKLELDPETFGKQLDPSRWPELKQRLEQVFRTRTRQEWCELLEGTDACFAPVLDFTEAPDHPHNRARQTFIDINGLTQPAPAPRFSRSQCDVPEPGSPEGADTESVLADWGFEAEEIEALRQSGALT
ncbi:MAG: CaiB/BaiF CoA-transferase family protein [Xanthomonadales bacterium]|nr:CaiB/BaiF CoA-transferase family protein [Xanthomonadales bacterium]